MKRIVFLINSLAGGGAERAMTVLLARSAPWRERYDMHLVLLDRDRDAYAPPDGVDLHRLDGKGRLWPALRQLRPLLAGLRPAVVMSALTRANLCNLLLARSVGHRSLICEHSHTATHHGGARGWPARMAIRRLYPRADAVIGVSRRITAALVDQFGVPAAKAQTLANPIDIAAIARQAAAAPALAMPRPYILAIGRLVEKKNFPLLLRAFAASRFPGALLILGEGPERPGLSALAARLGLGSRVVMPGFADNPFPLLRQAAGLVLSSNEEGLPTVLVEAMALGIPVIATDCPSGPAEILDGHLPAMPAGPEQARYGLLVPMNGIAPLARAIDRLDDPRAHADLAHRAALGAARYGLDETVAAYWRVIERLD